MAELLEAMREHRRRLDEAAGLSQPAQTAQAKKKKKQKRTHVSQFTAKELDMMSDSDFLKLKQ